MVKEVILLDGEQVPAEFPPGMPEHLTFFRLGKTLIGGNAYPEAERLILFFREVSTGVYIPRRVVSFSDGNKREWGPIVDVSSCETSAHFEEVLASAPCLDNGVPVR